MGACNLTTVALVAALCAVPGCDGSAAGPVDETTARAVLTQALDAWVAGRAAADLRTQAPEVIVVDQQWTDGARLVDYDFAGKGSFDGKTLRAQVNLTVVEPRARAPKKIGANFTIGLQPVITVVRVME
jgi:hypothetical protein